MKYIQAENDSAVWSVYEWGERVEVVGLPENTPVVMVTEEELSAIPTLGDRAAENKYINPVYLEYLRNLKINMSEVTE